MLAGHLSNQDEDEVEDELEELQREVVGPVSMPEPPTTDLPHRPVQEPRQTEAERAKERAKGRSAALAAISS